MNEIVRKLQEDQDSTVTALVRSKRIRQLSVKEKNAFYVDMQNLKGEVIDFDDSMAKMIYSVLVVLAKMNLYPDMIVESILSEYCECIMHPAKKNKLTKIIEEQIGKKQDKNSNNAGLEDLSAGFENMCNDPDKVATSLANCYTVEALKSFEEKTRQTIRIALQEGNAIWNKTITLNDCYAKTITTLGMYSKDYTVCQSNDIYDSACERCEDYITKFISNSTCKSEIKRYEPREELIEDVLYLSEILCECLRYFALILKNPTESVMKFVTEKPMRY